MTAVCLEHVYFNSEFNKLVKWLLSKGGQSGHLPRTYTLCFSKFLLCYALMPNTKPVYAQVCVLIMLSEMALYINYYVARLL